MLVDKAELLMQLQRVQRAQQELQREVEQLRERAAADQELVRLQVGGRSGLNHTVSGDVCVFALAGKGPGWLLGPLGSHTPLPASRRGVARGLWHTPASLHSPPQAERWALLDRVQQLSRTEAEASAGVERLRMENDALAGELEQSQEVCREMLAARRAARDALSEMSAQNARLVTAYVERKQEAAALREALRRQERDAEVGVEWVCCAGWGM